MDDEDWAGRGYTRKLEVSEAAMCPSCGAQAEPEQDGDVTYFSCGCGMDFGYQVVQSGDTCAAGIPLGQLATLGGMAEAETDCLVWGTKKPESESAVFLGSLIPLRPEEN